MEVAMEVAMEDVYADRGTGAREGEYEYEENPLHALSAKLASGSASEKGGGEGIDGAPATAADADHLPSGDSGEQGAPSRARIRAGGRRASFIDTLVFFEERGIGGRPTVQSVVMGSGKKVSLARSVVAQSRGAGEEPPRGTQTNLL